MSADISPATRKHLEELMQIRPSLESERSVEILQPEEKTDGKYGSQANVNVAHAKEKKQDIFQTDKEIAESDSRNQRNTDSHEIDHDDDTPHRNSHAHPRTIEIVLTADSEFFNLLTQELSSIDALQAQQKTILTAQLTELGKEVSAVAKPSKSRSHSDMYAWREIFSLYKDASLFFASTERDRGARSAAQARERIEWFSRQLQAQNLVWSITTAG
jgi:hypothetical protein